MSRLNVLIGGDATQFNRTLGNVKKDAIGAGKAIGAGFLGPLAGGAAITGLTMVGKAAIDAADAVGKGAGKLGMGVEEYQRLSKMADFAGASIEQLTPAIARMSRVMMGADEESKSAQKALERLGLSAAELDGLSPDKTFEKVAKAIGDIPDPLQRAAAAQEVFGRGGVELMNLINNYDQLANQVKDIPVMTAEAVKAAEQFKDAMDKVGVSIQASLINSGMVEYLSKAAEGMAEIAKEEGGFQKLKALLGFHTDKQKAAIEKAARPVNRARVLKESASRQGLTEHLSEDEKRHLEQGDEKTARHMIEIARERKKIAEEEAEVRKRLATDEQAAAEEQARLDKEAEKAAEKEAQLRERAEEMTRQGIDDLNHAVKMQEMKNQGLEREAAIQDALYQAMKRNSELTESDISAITEGAGKLFALNQKLEEVKTEAEGPSWREGSDQTATALERIGAIMGGGAGGDDMGLRVQREMKGLAEKQLAKLSEIADKTGANVLTEA
jgi:hypothetical protein